MSDLQRFIEAQKQDFDLALKKSAGAVREATGCGISFPDPGTGV